MKKLRLLVAICMGIVLSQPVPYSGTCAVQALEDETMTIARISIKTGVPSAQVQATIECTSDPDIETQTITATASDTGRATIRYERVEGMSYTISLTVNGKVYTMADSDAYTATCDGLTVEGIRAGVDAEGMQTLTVTVSLADVPEPEKPEPAPEPEPTEPKPEKPAPMVPVVPEAPAEPKPKKDISESTEQMQKMVSTPSTVAQGMPTGCHMWNPISWLISLFRVCL